MNYKNLSVKLSYITKQHFRTRKFVRNHLKIRSPEFIWELNFIKKRN